MTLQQLKYVVAIDRYRSFARAAEHLDITQPTLSALLVKLESELDVRIFERTNKQVTPTAVGEKIIRQAERAVHEAERIAELAAEEKGAVSGTLTLSAGPTIAPYLLPKFIKRYSENYPEVRLTINEMKADAMIGALQLGQIDVGIAVSGNRAAGIVEIPFYTEPFQVYVAESCWRKLPVFSPEQLEHEKMWIMKESQCMRDSAFSFCKARSAGKRIYEAGSIETLIRIVDQNGGFTIIPEMHLPFLTDAQRRNVRPIGGKYLSGRSVSIYIRQDFVRERLLNSVVTTLTGFIPGKMVEREIAENGVRIDRWCE